MPFQVQGHSFQVLGRGRDSLTQSLIQPSSTAWPIKASSLEGRKKPLIGEMPSLLASPSILVPKMRKDLSFLLLVMREMERYLNLT